MIDAAKFSVPTLRFLSTRGQSVRLYFYKKNSKKDSPQISSDIDEIVKLRHQHKCSRQLERLTLCQIYSFHLRLHPY